MQRITEITRNDILDLFKNGLDVGILFSTEIVHYTYHGRLEEIEFLSRIYDLEKMPSFDSRYQNALGDIWQHTVNNDDYPDDWVFTDERFMLKNGSDEVYLNFICEIFHPTVRIEKSYWENFLEEINTLLKNDGYELYISNQISGRDVYSWRIYENEEDGMFIPYSQRYKEDIKNNSKKISLKIALRNQIANLIEKNDFEDYRTDETGWDYPSKPSFEVLKDIKQFYIPMSYDNKNKYSETDDILDIVLKGSPYHVFDILEFFEKYIYENNFETKVNQLFDLHKLHFKMIHGKIENTLDTPVNLDIINNINEAGLKELLQKATTYYASGDTKIAAEKLWDAFERLKTYYSPTLNKKKSVGKIINEMGNNEQVFIDLFEEEFNKLTLYGNSFNIRHHEKTVTNIDDLRHYDYFYKRCISLISTALKFIG
ncbi:AbiJ-NTD4 domain-containing protein [Enterococcus casseliflavus]|uniref:AbiJ-related protein n=1 Tax=Enterococcus casseliflavus TaxID=37734 RepID=UPI0039A40462